MDNPQIRKRRFIIVTMIINIIQEYLNNLKLAMSMIERNQQALSVSIALMKRSRKRYRPRDPYCRPGVRVLLLDYLHNENLDFKHHFRVSRPSFWKIIELIKPKSNMKTHGWKQEIDLLVFLFWLGCCSPYRIIGTVFSISSSTVHDMLKRTLNAIVGKAKEIVKFPEPDAYNEICDGFSSLANCDRLKCVLGAIDGCHIRVKVPENLHKGYVNKKVFYSVQMQGICDHRGKFLDVFVGNPGSIHDDTVLTISPVYIHALYPPENYIILGNSSYGCIKYPVTIVTPFESPTTPIQENFNTIHSGALSIAEKTFGILKVRWRCLFTMASEVDVQKAPSVILACSVMHNICIDCNDEWEPVPHVMLSVHNPPDEVDGCDFREILAHVILMPND